MRLGYGIDNEIAKAVFCAVINGYLHLTEVYIIDKLPVLCTAVRNVQSEQLQ